MLNKYQFLYLFSEKKQITFASTIDNNKSYKDKMDNLFTKRLKLMIVALSILASSLQSFSQVVFKLDATSGAVNDVVEIDLRTLNFTDLVSAQFSIKWDPTVVEYINVNGFNLADLDATNFNIDNAANGQMTFYWFDNDALGVTVPDNSSLFRLRFRILNQNYTQINLVGEPTPIEVTDANGNFVPLQFGKGGQVNGAIAKGNVFWDMNNDCVFNFGDVTLKDWIVTAEHSNNKNLYDLTSNTGSYTLYNEPGTFTVKVIKPAPYWEQCQETYVVNMPNFGDEIVLDIPVKPIAGLVCPYLDVDISSGVPKSCNTTQYLVNFKNKGTAVANGVYIEVLLDEKALFVNSTITPSNQQGNLYTFQLGDLLPGEEGSIKITALLSCNDVKENEAIETVVDIYPKNDCITPNPSWDGVSLKTTTKCENNEVKLIISNPTTNDMVDPTNQYVIEDDIMYFLGPNDVDAGQEVVYTYPASGKTYRVMAEQTPNHPGNSFPTAAIEGCSSNNEYNTGYYKQFKEDDNDFAFVKDVQELKLEDNNTVKLATAPKGYDILNYIDRKTPIDYTIAFQNKSFDTVYNAFVIDTFSTHLDMSTLVMGTSSHPISWEILDSNVVKINFWNINLPDSIENDANSRAFVKFRINQKPNIPNNTIILNKVKLITNYVTTYQSNNVFHTIGEGFINIINSENNIGLNNELNVVCYPNPFVTYTDLMISQNDFGRFQKIDVQLYNSAGQLLQQGVMEQGNYRLWRKDLPEGMYVINLISHNDKTLIKNFKISVK